MHKIFKAFIYLIKRIYRYVIKRINNLFLKEELINGRKYYIYKSNIYPWYLNQGNAVSFIKDKALKHCRGKGIDVGAGMWPLEGAIPVRDEKELNAYKLDIFEDNSLDYVFSSHCLEHLDDWQGALLLWIRKLKKGGILFLYLPHKSMLLWRPYSPWVRDEHKHIFDRETIESFLIKNGCVIIDSEKDKDIYFSFYIIAKKI